MIAAHNVPPIDLIYRGTLHDTAMVVGLVQTHAPIRSVQFDGMMSPSKHSYFDKVDTWLISKGYPKIERTGKVSGYARFFSPRTWGWGKEECQYAIRLAGLELPPNF